MSWGFAVAVAVVRRPTRLRRHPGQSKPKGPDLQGSCKPLQMFPMPGDTHLTDLIGQAGAILEVRPSSG